MMKIVKVPSNYGGLEKADGVELAPDKVIEEMKDIYLNEQYRKKEIEIVEIERRKLEDGNKIIEAYDGDVFIGGDHSISYHSFKGFAGNYKNPGLIVFDAHPDVYELFEFPSHQDWLRHLIKDGLLKKENVAIIGLRNVDRKELDYLRENKIRIYDINQVWENREDVCDNIMEFARNFDGLYLSIDVDVIDPSMAPGTGYIEPGGMTVRELVYFLHRLKMLKNLARMDIVEINPKKDVNNMTSRLGAKIISEMM